MCDTVVDLTTQRRTDALRKQFAKLLEDEEDKLTDLCDTIDRAVDRYLNSLMLDENTSAELVYNCIQAVKKARPK